MSFVDATLANKSPTFYDKLEDVYDELHYKKRKGAKHACGVEIEAILPSEGEVRLLGNRHRQCAYYSIGTFFIPSIFTMMLLFKTLILSLLKLKKSMSVIY